MLSARATRGLELALFLGLVSPLLLEWLETTSASSRLSYALLVPALALVLAIRAARGGSGKPLPRPTRTDDGWAAACAAASGLALLAGTLGGVFTVSLCAVPLAALAFTARTLGRAGLRRYAAPLALLFLMVPPPMPLLDRAQPVLVQASGATAVTLLRPFDPAVSWRGATLTYRAWTLTVAEACSGSGTLLVLTVLSVFLAGLFRLRCKAALLLVLGAAPLALLVNGLRIASSAVVIDRWGAEAGRGLAHELLGEAVVLLGAGFLVFVVERASARGPIGRRA